MFKMEEELRRTWGATLAANANQGHFLRADVRATTEGPAGLAAGTLINLIGDESEDTMRIDGTYRILAAVAAPEGYTAIIAHRLEKVHDNVSGEIRPGYVLKAQEFDYPKIEYPPLAA